VRPLVVNADDLGLHPRLDEGIFRARREGILTSATVLVTGRTAAGAIATAQGLGLGVGVHLCLATGLPPAAPPSQVPNLAPQGRFRPSWAALARALALGRVPLAEVKAELRAQLHRAKALGARVDHLDAHQHLHLLPGVAALVDALACEQGLPLRWPTETPSWRWVGAPGPATKSLLLGALARNTSRLRARRVPAVGVFESGALTEARALRLLRTLGEGPHELVSHPGLAPGAVEEDPSWRYGWEMELATLTSPRVRDAVAQGGFTLCRYADLAT
jgi:predicted glycoside hydrolase/deacetylase ChbG (UPF0249 family)